MTARTRARTPWAGWPVPRRLALVACVAVGACATSDEEPANPEPAVLRVTESGGARLTLALDRDALTTAGTATLRLEIESAESDAVEFPDSEDGFGEFAVVRDEAAGDRLLEDGRVARGREYVLQPFLPGEYELPALKVVLNGSTEVLTEPVAITVESVLDDPEDAELREIGDPVDMPVPWWWWALSGAGLAAAIAATAWWLRRRKAARRAPRVVTPHEAALAALDALLAAGLPGPEQLGAFYLRLSGIVRRYVEERFGLRAPEQTTEEFLAAMAMSPSIRGDHQRLLRGFLELADMVKFAKFAPRRGEIDASVEAARRFVRQTVPDELIAADKDRSRGAR